MYDVLDMIQMHGFLALVMFDHPYCQLCVLIALTTKFFVYRSCQPDTGVKCRGISFHHCRVHVGRLLSILLPARRRS